MSFPKISVIVPVYNVEEYINTCVDSILNQTFEDYELILVNDGSTDTCGKICDDYSKLDNRILVIHKENGGLSSARNAGLSIAKGEYIIFIDSDDYIERDTLLKSYKTAKENDADTVIFGLKLFWDDSEHTEILSYNKHNHIEIYSNEDAIKKYLVHDIRGYTWNRLVRKDILTKNNIIFPVGVAYEDIYPTLKTLSVSNKVILLDEIMYNYRQRNGSISKIIKEKYVVDYIGEVYRAIELSENLPYSKNISEHIECFKIYTYLNAVNWYIKLMNYNVKDVKNKYNKFFSKINIDYSIYKVFKSQKLSKGYKLIYTLWKMNMYPMFIKYNIIK